jgi:hypothetical protein
MQPTRGSSDRTSPILLFGLAPGGVCRASLSPGCWWALTPPFHPYRDSCEPRRSAFCCTFPILGAPLAKAALDGGRYPPPCPVEPGLSSPEPKLDGDRPADSRSAPASYSPGLARGGPGWPRSCRLASPHSVFPDRTCVTPGKPGAIWTGALSRNLFAAPSVSEVDAATHGGTAAT